MAVQDAKGNPQAPVARPRDPSLAGHISATLEQRIREGQLRPGTRLPSERVLAEQFGVSRTVVREAVRTLVAKGLLEVRPGSGMLIRGPSVSTLAQSMRLYLRAGQYDLDYRKVNEVRSLLEIEIAGLAAERRTAVDLEALTQILDEMIYAQQDAHAFPQADVDFHTALAFATHNELLPLLLDSLQDVMIEVRRLGYEVAGSSSEAIGYHQAILEQVRLRNGAGARAAMRAHLVASDAVLRQALTQRAGLHASC